MSSYEQNTINPDTGKIESAVWLDDYFGRHRYGVRFPSGKVFRGEECRVPEQTSNNATNDEKLDRTF